MYLARGVELTMAPFTQGPALMLKVLNNIEFYVHPC
jgi:hypothetical protein